MTVKFIIIEIIVLVHIQQIVDFGIANECFSRVRAQNLQFSSICVRKLSGKRRKNNLFSDYA